jgi:hypothetical protein
MSLRVQILKRLSLLLELDKQEQRIFAQGMITGLIASVIGLVAAVVVSRLLGF